MCFLCRIRAIKRFFEWYGNQTTITRMFVLGFIVYNAYLMPIGSER